MIALIGMTFVLGCENSAVDPNTAPTSLKLIQLDSVWVFNADIMRQVSVKLQIDEFDDPTINCTITDNLGESVQFQLYDDGNTGRWHDSAEYADSLTGDNVPGDNVFSRRINSLFAVNSGEHIFTFEISSPDDNNPLNINVLVRENSPPEFISHSEDDSVFSRGIGDVFTVTMSDVEGNEDLSDPEVVIYRTIPPADDATYFGMNRIAADRWNWNNKAKISVGLITGSYPVAYRAQDNYLRQLGQWAYSDTFSVWLENLPPEVTSFEGPDTVWLPRLGDPPVLFDFSIMIQDDQTAFDLDTLHMSLLDSDSVTLARFIYIDGRSALDTIPLDGRFRPAFSIADTNEAPKEYTFKWTPTDRAGNTGETYESHLLILGPEENRTQSGIIKNYDKAMYKKSYSPFK